MKETWNDITIETYQELTNVSSEGVQRSVDIISILTDIDSEDVRKLPLREFMDYTDKSKFITTTPDAYVNKTFILNKIEYGLIPDMDFISAGEWLDLENFKDDSINNMHLIIAVLYRPVTIKHPDGSYEIEEHKTNGFLQRAELFKELSITKVMGAQTFFLLFALEYSLSMQDSLTEEPKKMKKTRVKKTSKTKTTRPHTKKNN